MKIALIIDDEQKRSLGDCLSSAVVFSVYDSAIKSFYDVEPPDLLDDGKKAYELSLFFKDRKIDVVVGKDFGPKAKAALEENNIQWFTAEDEMNNDKLVNIILKKINHE